MTLMTLRPEMSTCKANLCKMLVMRSLVVRVCSIVI